MMFSPSLLASTDTSATNDVLRQALAAMSRAEPNSREFLTGHLRSFQQIPESLSRENEVRVPHGIRNRYEALLPRFLECKALHQYETILKDKDLFWIAFCQAFVPESNREISCHNYVWEHQHGMSLECKLQAHGAIYQCIQLFREQLLQTLEAKRRFVSYICENRVQCLVFFQQEQPTVENAAQYSKVVQIRGMVDTLQGAISSLGGRVQVEKMHIIKIAESAPASSLSFPFAAQKITIDWVDHATYPIPPLEVRELPPQQILELLCPSAEEEFSLYTILMAEGRKVQVPATLLKGASGPVFAALCSSEMKEAKNQTIDLTRFSQSCIQTWIDFLYKTSSVVDDHYIIEKRVDLVELIDFAHTYQIEPLFCHAVNLLSLSASPVSKEFILELSKTYESTQLQLLYEHLNADASQIGDPTHTAASPSKNDQDEQSLDALRDCL